MSGQVKDSLVSKGLPVDPDASSLGTVAGSRMSRKRAARYPCHDQCRVRILSADCGLFGAAIVEIALSELRLKVQSLIGKGQKIQIALPEAVTIFGEVRHCRPAGEAFNAIVHIEDVIYANPAQKQTHAPSSKLKLFVAGKGLAASEVLNIGDHLQWCASCSARYEEMLNLKEHLRTPMPDA